MVSLYSVGINVHDHYTCMHELGLACIILTCSVIRWKTRDMLCHAPTTLLSIAVYLLNEKCCSVMGVVVGVTVMLLLDTVFIGEALVINITALTMASVSSKTELLIIQILIYVV